jgi:hypothetical protein
MKRPEGSTLFIKFPDNKTMVSFKEWLVSCGFDDYSFIVGEMWDEDYVGFSLNEGNKITCEFFENDQPDKI